MWKREVRSVTAVSPCVRDSKIARRLGSASAWKILFSATAALCVALYISHRLWIVKRAVRPRRIFEVTVTNRRFPWAKWSTERLLQLRIKDLGLTIQGTWIEPRIDSLYETLERRGFRLRPHIWLSEEWFSPLGVPGFAIPFYLAHPRLIRLERSQMLDVEGGTHNEFTRIMQHETGHAIQHGYQLQRRRAWQRLFGKSSQRYPDYYRPNPASKRYVQHLRLWYAQSHPDEDFAETFAVWLRSSRGEWRRRYAGWPALKKLEYVDELMDEIADTPPIVATRKRMEPIATITKTLAQHYAERKAKYSEVLPDNTMHMLYNEGHRDWIAL